MTEFAPHRATWESFIDCMHNGADKDVLARLFTENAVLNSPLGDEPLIGRESVVETKYQRPILPPPEHQGPRPGSTILPNRQTPRSVPTIEFPATARSSGVRTTPDELRDGRPRSPPGPRQDRGPGQRRQE